MEFHYVLETDYLEEKRWAFLFQVSRSLQEKARAGSTTYSSFPSLLADMFMLLFQENPRLRQNISPVAVTNEPWISFLLIQVSIAELRDLTKLNDLAAAVATIILADKLLQQFNYRGTELSSSSGASSIRGSKANLDRHLHEATKQTKETLEALDRMMGGLRSQQGRQELSRIPLQDKLLLAEKLRHHPKLKKIMEHAGRFIQTAQIKQRQKHKESMQYGEITLGGELARVLPSEWVKFLSPERRRVFLKEWSEGKLMQMDRSGKESLKRGPIVLILDQSGSMQSQDELSKGFMLALMSIAKKQLRDFAYIPFASHVKETYLFPKGKIQASQLIELAESFLNGGTNFEAALKEGLKLIELNPYQRADIIFITDGMDSYTEWYADTFVPAKKRKGFRVITILMHTHPSSTIGLFSDEVIAANSLLDECVSDAFKL
ncbi:VWA domain-containing protein [Paenibacillus tarimensis]|uniref:VWA domain-containing protein n=1 Tax=Paenibacillus tarimensis TaxID=416012 RepID=UPI001F38AA5E|nr:VWA domain-containing protein [Paenibacillus tarimensis]MCF2946339.1 VWA domain-containing protein [Paenibacillus tarimensis]